jgi:hypothetical protein
MASHPKALDLIISPPVLTFVHYHTRARVCLVILPDSQQGLAPQTRPEAPHYRRRLTACPRNLPWSLAPLVGSAAV